MNAKLTVSVPDGMRDAIKELAAFYDNDPDVVRHVVYKNAQRILAQIDERRT